MTDAAQTLRGGSTTDGLNPLPVIAPQIVFGAVALGLCVSAAAWVLDAQRAGVATRLAAAPLMAPRPLAAAMPSHLPLFDPTPFATAPLPFGDGAPLGSVFAALAPPIGVVAAVATPKPTPEPAAEIVAAAEPDDAPAAPATPDAVPVPFPRPALPDLAADVVPLPTPRPAELRERDSRVQDARGEDMRDAEAQPPFGMPRRMGWRHRRSVVAAAPAQDNRSFFEKLFGGFKPSPGPALAYAAPEDGVFANARRATASPTLFGSDRTAVYDIAAHTVYLPNGDRLEAHSGLGDKLDDPNHVSVRNRGATPPAVYDLTLREKMFHGVQALRLNPVGGQVYGRVGLLAHSYMLGPNGDSNGCVSFRDYNAFLRAYRNGEVTRLEVVARR